MMKTMNSLLLSFSDGRGCWVQVECDLACPLSELQRAAAPALNLAPSDWYFEDREGERHYGTAVSCGNPDAPLQKLRLKEGDSFLFVQNSDRAFTYTVRVKAIQKKQVDAPQVVRTHGLSTPWPAAVTPATWNSEAIRDALAPFPFSFVERERKYLCAAANLFGACFLPMVESIMQYYEKDFDRNRFYAIADILRHDDSLDCFLIGFDDLSDRPVPPSPVEERFVVHEDIPLFDSDPGELVTELFVEQRQNLANFTIPPDREEFLKWADPLYQEPTPLLASLRHTLEVKQQMYPEDVDEFVEQLAFMARTGHTPEETLSELCDTWELVFSDWEELDDFCDCCIRWVCSIPQWYEGGFLPQPDPETTYPAHPAGDLSEFEQFRQRKEKERNKHS